MTAHDAIIDRLSDYLDEDLEARSRAEVEAHLREACAARPVHEDSSTDVAVQGGAGVNFQLAGFTTFVEAKFVNIFGDGSSTRYIPITFGFRF